MRITKSDLLLKHYSETAFGGDNPKITGKPDSTLFNRNEVYEVVYMINKVLGFINGANLAKAYQLEKLIDEKLPSNTRSQEKVFNWLVNNLN